MILFSPGGLLRGHCLLGLRDQGGRAFLKELPLLPHEVGRVRQTTAGETEAAGGFRKLMQLSGLSVQTWKSHA